MSEPSGERPSGAAGRWAYVLDAAPKPYIHPLVTPGGTVLTRVSPADHPWHRGLWFTIKYLDGENFWEEEAPFGLQRQSGDEVEWVRADGTVAVRERRRLDEVPLDDEAWALDWSSNLEADADVVLDRTPFTTWGGYGGLSLRGAGDWTDTRLLLGDGTTARRVTGTPSRWCDLSGPGGGVAVFDAPGNPRAPSPWYGSTRSALYGEEWSNFLNAAFLFHEPLTLVAGQPLHFRYRLVVHDGQWEADRVTAAYDAWTPAP
jgi:hypothetical protein